MHSPPILAIHFHKYPNNEMQRGTYPLNFPLIDFSNAVFHRLTAVNPEEQTNKPLRNEG